MDERINAPEKANDITSDSAFICHSQVQGRLTSFTGYQPTNENTGDWFEYIWSMTRAIRKDITQQDLKDTVTAELVEKCARFHIICAERLIEEVCVGEKNMFSFKNKFTTLMLV